MKQKISLKGKDPFFELLIKKKSGSHLQKRFKKKQKQKIKNKIKQLQFDNL